MKITLKKFIALLFLLIAHAQSSFCMKRKATEGIKKETSLKKSNNNSKLDYNFTSNNQKEFDQLCLEIKDLKSKNHEETIIELSSFVLTESYPTLYERVYLVTCKLSLIANIEVPTIYLQVNTDNYYENAASQDNKIYLGIGTIKMSLWRREFCDFLETVISHEIGHLFHKKKHFSKKKNKIKSEHEADQFAIEILKQSQQTLANSITIENLAAELSNAYFINLSVSQINKILRKIMYKLTQSTNDLYIFKYSTSHALYRYLIQKLTLAINKKLLSHNDPELTFYETICTLCNNPSNFLNKNFDILALNFKNDEIAISANKTHPAPYDRMIFIESLQDQHKEQPFSG